MANGRTLIVVKSFHHKNTAKVAAAMAEVLAADVVTPEEADPSLADEYDLIGFGSGVYFGMFHPKLTRWIRRIHPPPAGRAAFVFSTSGTPFLSRLWNWPTKSRLARKGFRVVGEFSCRGFDTVGPLWLIGGLNRGHPNAQDLSRAADFAAGLVERAIP